jgi:isochorismate pyruvate lyase
VAAVGLLAKPDRVEIVSISEVRARIDQIDEQIVQLLATRQKLVKKAARYKADEHAVHAPDRRAAMMTRLHKLSIQEDVAPEVVRRVYDVMIDAFIELELHEHARITEKYRGG